MGKPRANKPRANATPNQPPTIDPDDPLGLGEDRPAPAPPVDLDDPLADAEELPPEAGDTADPEMEELVQEALKAAGPEEPALFTTAPTPERFIFTDEHVELRGTLELAFSKGPAKHTIEVKATLRLRLQAPDQAAYLERTGAVPGARNVYESGQPTEDHDPASGVHTARNRWGSVLAWTFRPMGDVGPLPLELTADAAIRVADVSANNGAVTLSIGLKPFVVGIDHARLVCDLDGCDVMMTGRAAQQNLL
jgi:hypothetical protein